MKTTQFIALIGLLLATFVSNAQKPRYLKTDGYEGVVFPMHPATYPKDAKFAFMPTNEEIAIMEKKITASIGALLSNFEKRIQREDLTIDSVRHCDIVENLPKFKRQYFGMKIKGEKVINVYFFRNVDEDWTEKAIVPGMSKKCEEFALSFSITSGKLYGFFTDLSHL